MKGKYPVHRTLTPKLKVSLVVERHHNYHNTNPCPKSFSKFPFKSFEPTLRYPLWWIFLWNLTYNVTIYTCLETPGSPDIISDKVVTILCLALYKFLNSVSTLLLNLPFLPYYTSLLIFPKSRWPRLLLPPFLLYTPDNRGKCVPFPSFS